MVCRGCSYALGEPLLDLGPAPFSNAFVDDINSAEIFYPLRVYVCERCYLMQLPSDIPPVELFNADYAYFTSASAPAVDHARMYAECAVIRHGLHSRSRVVEIASNDGYLLQHFVHRGIPVLGIEPAESVAKIAIDKGINTTEAFFSADLAKFLEPADLLIANNVLAHVPDLHDFIEGLRIALAPDGRISLEFPHLLSLIREGQFDTIYHEHFSYFSLTMLNPIFEQHGLSVTDVERLDTHGGSLRVTLAHKQKTPSITAAEIMSQEWAYGLSEMHTFFSFAEIVKECRDRFLSFLNMHSNMTIAGYGAPAKAATFLNYCGVRSDRIPWTVDSTPFKQGKFLPGSRIPIHAEDYITTHAADIMIIFPWNWADHIVKHARELGYTGRFYTAIPRLMSVA